MVHPNHTADEREDEQTHAMAGVTTTEEEPATAHDVTIGGGLGVVGGAIVGALAGGPIGAVVGAVVAGAASAAAVDAVDKRDHDYAPTETETDAAPVGEYTPAGVMAQTAPAETVVIAEARPDMTESIRLRAYEIYVLNGCHDGRDVKDWLEAEREFHAV